MLCAMTDAKIDFSSAPIVAPQGDQWTSLRQKVRALAEAQAAEEAAQREHELAKAALAVLRDQIVPEHTRAMGWGGGEVDGYEVTIKPGVFGGIKNLGDDPVARASAFAYLEELGEGKVVQRFLTISMGKDAASVENRIREAVAVIQAEVKVPITLEPEITVHPSTLSSIARKRLTDGDDIDLKRLGLVNVRRATVKVVK